MAILTYEQIANLSILRQFYYLAWRLVGVNIALVSPDLKHSLAFGISESWSPFCVALRQMGGEKHCLECDRVHFSEVELIKHSYHYHCWAGLAEFITPILLDNQILALIQCGQALDTPPTEALWLEVSEKLRRVGLDPGVLREKFFGLRVISEQTQQDLLALLELFGNYLAYAQYQILMAEATQQSRVEERALSYIRHHFGELITLDDIARAASTSKRNLSRVFQARTGRTVLDVIQDMRIEEACQLLQDRDHSCAKVAFDCGFGSVQQFNRVFKKHKQCTPREWQQRRQEGSGRG